MGRNDNRFRSNGGANCTVSGVLLKYDGVAVGSNEKIIEVESSSMEKFSTPLDVVKRKDYENIANPTDLYSVSLSGKVSAIPQNSKYETLGVWSEEQSSIDGKFSTPIKMTLKADAYFSSVGVTLIFDEYRNIFANKVKIIWFRDDQKLEEATFYPDFYEYFYGKSVELFNRVDIVFYSINAPKSRLRIQTVAFGKSFEISSKMLKNSIITQKIDPISATVPISTLDFSVVFDDDIDVLFQKKQTVEANFNKKIKGTFFIKKAQKTGKNSFSVSCEDYIGLLDSVFFEGGLYEDASAYAVAQEICEKVGARISFPNEFKNRKITGRIPRTTCRKALQQILFALQLFADTSNSRKIVAKTIDKTTYNIPRERIMQGVKASDKEIITGVEVVAHVYKPTQEEVVLYDGSQSGAGEDIELIFDEPHTHFVLENGNFKSISENRVVFDATDKTLLKGKKVRHITKTKTKKNTQIQFGEEENIKRIDGATLVNPQNIDIVLDNCYNYLVKNKTVSAKIVEGKHENIDGDGYFYDFPIEQGMKLNVDVAFDDNFVGNVESQSFRMNGGILVKECILK